MADNVFAMEDQDYGLIKTFEEIIVGLTRYEKLTLRQGEFFLWPIMKTSIADPRNDIKSKYPYNSFHQKSLYENGILLEYILMETP